MERMVIVKLQMPVKAGYDVEFPVDASCVRRGIFPRWTTNQRKKRNRWNRFGGVKVRHEANRDFVQILIIAEPKKNR